jgi:hypothetical protein
MNAIFQENTCFFIESANILLHKGQHPTKTTSSPHIVEALVYVLFQEDYLMFKRFTLMMSAAIGLLAFVVPTGSQSAAASTSKMQVQVGQSIPSTSIEPSEEAEARRRRAPRRRGGSPMFCPACGMG